MSRAIGTTCKLYYDYGDGPDPPRPGAFIRSSGSLYEVLKASRSPTIHGRYYLTVVRCDPGMETGEARVYPLFWYRR